MPPSPRPSRARRGSVLACAVAAAGVLGLAAAGAADPPTATAKSPNLITAFNITGVQCVPGPANTVRARVRLWMRVVNYGPGRDWADRMEAKVRLESTEPGINIHSNWRGWKTPALLQDTKYFQRWDLLTEPKSGTAEWKVHVKLIWHRKAPIPNVTKDVYRSFAGNCATSTGALPPPAPALPSTNSGGRSAPAG